MCSVNQAIFIFQCDFTKGQVAAAFSSINAGGADAVVPYAALLQQYDNSVQQPF